MTRTGIWRILGLGILLMGGVFASLGWAEQIEMVTYYPSGSADSASFPRLHAGTQTIGDPYSLQNPQDPGNGWLWVANNIRTGRNLTSIGDFVLYGQRSTDNFPTMKLGLNSLQFGSGLAAPDMVLLKPYGGFLRLRNYAGDYMNGEYTVFAIDGNRNFGHEATLSLHLGTEPNDAYMDVYNMNYPGSIQQYGMRITKAGTAQLFPFVIDFYNYNAHAVIAEGIRVLPDGKVGIGGVTPLNALSVNGDTKVSGRVVIGSSSVDVETKLRDLEDRIRALGG